MKNLINQLVKTPWQYLLFFSSIFAIVGDYYAKVWSETPKNSLFVVALLGYSISGVFFIPILREKGLVLASIIWILVNSLGFIIIGLVLFKEQLTLLQGIGLVFGLIALILLSF